MGCNSIFCLDKNTMFGFEIDVYFFLGYKRL